MTHKTKNCKLCKHWDDNPGSRGCKVDYNLSDRKILKDDFDPIKDAKNCEDFELKFDGELQQMMIDNEDAEYDLQPSGNPGSRPIKVNLPEDNFIMQYIEAMRRRTDAYLEYHFIAAISILSRVSDRRVFVDFKHGRVFPNIWVISLGDSTISRKSTAMDLAENIASYVNINGDLFLPHDFSPESFVEILSEQEHGAFWLDEAAGLLAKMTKSYMSDMRDLFCRIYDNKRYHKKLRTSKSKGSKTEFKVEEPFVTQWLATTPDNFRSYATTLDLMSGWLVRYLYVAPEHPKEWKGYETATDEDEKTRSEVINLLVRIKKNIDNEDHIEIKFEEEALDFFHEWQKSREMEATEKQDKIEMALLGRYSNYVVKLAMLFELGQLLFTPVVHLNMIKEACRLIDDYFLPSAKKIVRQLEWDEIKNLQEKILGTLERAGGKLTRRELLQRLHKPLREVEEALEALIASTEIYIDEDEETGKVVISLTEKEGVAGVASVSHVSGVNDVSKNNGDKEEDINKNDRINATPETLETTTTHETSATGNQIDVNDFTDRINEIIYQWDNIDKSIDDIYRKPEAFAKLLKEKYPNNYNKAMSIVLRLVEEGKIPFYVREYIQKELKH